MGLFRDQITKNPFATFRATIPFPGDVPARRVQVASGRLTRRPSEYNLPLGARFLRQKLLLDGSVMPRRPKPFFHRGWWVTNVGGIRTKLAQGRGSKAAAEDALLDLLREQRTCERRPCVQLTVRELCDSFLDWIELHRAAATYTDYRRWLREWVTLHGAERAREIRAIDLEDWKQQLAGRLRAPTSINHAIVAVKTCWSWGFKNELLVANPLRRVPKLFAEGRERVLTADEFRTLLRHSDPTFRQVLLFLRLTGCRPGELRALRWDQIDFENHVSLITRHKSRRTARTRRPRIITLVPIVENLLRWRLRTFGRTERVFLNARGRPWTNNALRCRMRRLRDRAGIGPDENGERIVLYTARHTFGTTASALGVVDRRLADLMGHTDPKMTQKYIHLAHPDLHQAAQQATKNYLGANQNVARPF